MKINITFDIDDADRFAVAWHGGQKGKATRAQMKEFILAKVSGELAAALSARKKFWDGKRDSEDGFPGSSE